MPPGPRPTQRGMGTGTRPCGTPCRQGTLGWWHLSFLRTEDRREDREREKKIIVILGWVLDRYHPLYFVSPYCLLFLLDFFLLFYNSVG